MFLWLFMGGGKDLDRWLDKVSPKLSARWFNVPLTIRKIIMYGLVLPAYVALVIFVIVYPGY